MKSLVIGMGIGHLYKSVLTELGHTVFTVDVNPNVGADFTNIGIAFASVGDIDTVHICTPNFTHEELARHAGKMNAKIVFVEKPGVKNHSVWFKLVRDFPATRFMMVKNNQYRKEIELFKTLADKSKEVYIKWNNKNRIPQPGSWFTNKELAFGGVSRDLIPHMLSYYCKLTNFTLGNKLYAMADQKWTLDQIDSTDYGQVNRQGIYNVDDFCELEFFNSKRWVLSANWKNNTETDISINFVLADRTEKFELGLCPEEAYKNMIAEAIQNIDNDFYWTEQFNQDMWIHKQIENL